MTGIFLIIFPLFLYSAERQNIHGQELIFIEKQHPEYDYFLNLAESGDNEFAAINPYYIHGISGSVAKSDAHIQAGR